MDFNYLQDKIRKYVDNAKARSEKLKVNLPNEIIFPYIKLVEEVGEVADLLEKYYGKRQEMSEEEFKQKFGGELSDIITFVTHLANFSGINLEEAIKQKLRELDKR